MNPERTCALVGVFQGGDLSRKVPTRTILQLAAYTAPEFQPVAMHINRLGASWPEQLAQHNPLVTAISINTWGEFKRLPDIVAQIKQAVPKTITVTGGVYPSVYHKETLQIPGVDILGIGYGDDGWMKITQILADGKDLQTLHGYPGIYITQKKNPDQVTCLPPIPLKKLKQPNYLAAKPDLGSYVGDRRSTAIDLVENNIVPNVLSGIGCVERCMFCINTLWQRVGNFGRSPIEMRPPKAIVEEIDTLLELMGSDQLPIYLASPDSFYDRDHFLAIVNELEQQRINQRIFLGLDAKVATFYNAIKEVSDLSERLHGKCHKIILAPETLHPETQNIVGKFTDVEELIICLDFCHDIQALPLVQMIVGFPTDSAETLQYSLDKLLFVRDSSPPFALTVHRATPFPGTDLYTQAIREQLIDPSADESIGDLTVGSALMGTKFLSSSQVDGWIDKFIREFYSEDYLKRLTTEAGHSLLLHQARSDLTRAIRGEEMK